MAAVNFYQVTSYPASPVANALYFLKRSGSKADLKLTDSLGAYYDIATDSKVLTTVITGLSIVNGAIVDTDTILAALGKSQGQINAINTALSAHTANTSNPHSVTKTQVGLGNVDNTSDANKPVSTVQQTALDLKANIASPTFTGTVSGITKSMVGLGNVVNADTTTTANITDSSNKRFITDAQQTVLGNTSGTNTGDQNLSGYQLTSEKDATGGYAGLTLFKINFKNALNTFTSFFTNSNTAARTYTFADRTGTIADDTDITNAKARANHTGTQLASTISDFNSAALAAAPAETTTTEGALINGATAKTTPVDADFVGLMDSAASNILKKLSWANVKATLKTYFDTLYSTNLNTTGTNTGDQNYNGIADFLIEPAVDQTAQGPRTNDLNAGATISIMELVILDSSSKWQKTDANTPSLYSGLLAIALANGTNNNAMLVALKGSVIRNDAWAWTPGATLYMSETAGAITDADPSTFSTDAAIRVIGFALTDDCIYFDPSPDYITHT